MLIRALIFLVIPLCVWRALFAAPLMALTTLPVAALSSGELIL